MSENWFFIRKRKEIGMNYVSFISGSFGSFLFVFFCAIYLWPTSGRSVCVCVSVFVLVTVHSHRGENSTTARLPSQTKHADFWWTLCFSVFLCVVASKKDRTPILTTKSILSLYNWIFGLKRNECSWLVLLSVLSFLLHFKMLITKWKIMET